MCFVLSSLRDQVLPDKQGGHFWKQIELFHWNKEKEKFHWIERKQKFHWNFGTRTAPNLP